MLKTATARELRWRGVALDEFTGAGWRKSNQARQLTQVDERGGLFQFGTTEDIRRLTTQTFFLEPLESPVLFAAPRVVAVQGCRSFVLTRRISAVAPSRLRADHVQGAL